MASTLSGTRAGQKDALLEVGATISRVLKGCDLSDRARNRLVDCVQLIERALPAEYRFGEYLDQMDKEAFFNMRDWLRKALEAQGAKQIAAGIGLGQADIDIELEGMHYNVNICPLNASDTIEA